MLDEMQISYMKIIMDNLQRLKELYHKYKVKTLYIFGSALTDKFSSQSDVDLLVDFNSEIDHTNYTDNFFDFYYSLRNLFNREVEPVDESSIQNKYFRSEMDNTKYLIYG